MNVCVSEPISWPRLERYGLGMVSAEERLTISVHLARCPICSACMQRIDTRADVLRLPLPAAPVRARRSPTRWQKREKRWLYGAAIAVLGILLVRALLASRELAPGDVALELMRLGPDGQQRVPTHFEAGDRFRARLSCPPSFRGEAELVVYQDLQRRFPLTTQKLDSCGTGRSLQGAFRIEGVNPASVCVVLAAAGSLLDRSTLARSPEQLTEPHVCSIVRPHSGR
jgi:hypothetical protein